MGEPVYVGQKRIWINQTIVACVPCLIFLVFHALEWYSV